MLLLMPPSAASGRWRRDPRQSRIGRRGYGNDTDFRGGITEIGLAYAVGIQSSTSLWPPGVEPLPPKQWSGRGGPTSSIRRDPEHQPISAKQLALDLPKKAWRRVTWREGTNIKLTGRFAAVRVRPAHRDYERSTPRPEEWCLIDWPADEPEPTKYFLSTLPANISLRALVNATKLRWRIERDYQDLTQELGLGHYEGRGWRGIHHHATLCIAAYGFLIYERGALPPLRTALHPALLGICPSRRLPTPRRRRSAPNGMCRTRSQPSADVLSSPSPGPSRDALVAMRQSEKPAKFPITDAVRLAGCGKRVEIETKILFKPNFALF